MKGFIVKIILVRHGESMANVWENIYDMSDNFNFLSLRGVKQAELAGLEIKEWLDGGHINHVISSDATRARQTTACIMQSIGEEHWKRDYTSDYRLNEWCFGAPNQDKWWEYESKENFITKIDNFYDDYIKPYTDTGSNDTFLIVSHYYTMRYLKWKIQYPTFHHMEQKLHLVDKDSKARINNAQPYYADDSIGYLTPVTFDKWKEDYEGGR